MRNGGTGTTDRDAEINELAETARGGDPRAVDALLRTLKRPVIVFCRARMSNGGPITPEDVAQDVLYAVCDALHRYDGSSPFAALVFGIAHNKVVDAFRTMGRDRSTPSDSFPEEIDTGDGPEIHALRTADTRVLRWALDQLPEHHREIIVYRVALQYSAEEVALKLGTTAGAVRVTQHRAMKKLRDLLRKHLDR